VNPRSTRFVAGVLILAALHVAEAQTPRPAAPPAPEPPAAGTADKPTGDALAQEAEGKPKEPEGDDKKEKPKDLTGKLAAGFTFTSGNSNTRSFNIALALQYDPRTKNIVKADGFYLRNSEDGASTVDRTFAHLRDEYYFRPRWFAFGDAQFLKDRFKEIDSLFAPTAGVGVRLIKTEARELTADLGAGAVFEKDTDHDRTSSGAVRAGESYLWKVSKSASFTESAFALWKTSDTSDAYYHFEAALGAEVAEHIELKVGLIDEYKRKPADSTVKRNDVAGIVQIEIKR
jgi:putative salt-induced outer membrane protein YdiY